MDRRGFLANTCALPVISTALSASESLGEVFVVQYDSNQGIFLQACATLEGAKRLAEKWAVEEWGEKAEDGYTWEQINGTTWTDGGDEYLSVIELEIQ